MTTRTLLIFLSSSILVQHPIIPRSIARILGQSSVERLVLQSLKVTLPDDDTAITPQFPWLLDPAAPTLSVLVVFVAIPFQGHVP